LVSNCNSGEFFTNPGANPRHNVVGLQLHQDDFFGREKPPMSTEKTNESAIEADNPIPLRQNVQEAIRRYLEDMGQSQPECLYRTLMAEVEPPLIEEVLRYTQGNQSKTARILGMTRNTLRTKLHRYDIVVSNGKY
jgi:Fis family transcriptional regulator